MDKLQYERLRQMRAIDKTALLHHYPLLHLQKSYISFDIFDQRLKNIFIYKLSENYLFYKYYIYIRRLSDNSEHLKLSLKYLQYHL